MKLAGREPLRSTFSSRLDMNDEQTEYAYHDSIVELVTHIRQKLLVFLKHPERVNAIVRLVGVHNDKPQKIHLFKTLVDKCNIKVSREKLERVIDDFDKKRQQLLKFDNNNDNNFFCTRARKSHQRV